MCQNPCEWTPGGHELEQQLTAGGRGQAIIADSQRLHRALERLCDLIRQHRIEPNGGATRTA
jgi:hypothetical protein